MKRLCLIFLTLVLVLVALVGCREQEIEAFFSTLPTEAGVKPIVVLYDTIIGENYQIDVGELLPKYGDGQYPTPRYLCMYGERIYFVTTSASDKISNSRIWSIASVLTSGEDLQIHYSHMFPNEFSISELDPTKPTYAERHFFCQDGKIVLYDDATVVEYDIAQATASVYAVSAYTFPTEEVVYEITDRHTITITKNGESKTLTVEDLKNSGDSLAAIGALAEKKNWDDKSYLEYFFTFVQVVDGEIYLLCRVMDYHGGSYAVILNYNFETGTCLYVTNVYTDDDIDDVYLVNHINM